jgi:hypothetical protein
MDLFWPISTNSLQYFARWRVRIEQWAAMLKRIAIISCIKTATHPHHITNDNIIKHTTPIVAWRVPIFPGCVAHAIHALLKAEPFDDNDKEEVEELQPLCIVSFFINNEYKLVDEPAFLRWGPAPTCTAERRTSIEFSRTKQEGVNPELARLYCTWQLEEGLPRFEADFAIDAPTFSLLVCLKHPRTPSPPLLVASEPFSRPCCCTFPMLFRPALVKPIRQGHQAGQGANQPSCHQHHQNQPWADCCIQVHSPLSNPIAQRFVLHFEAKFSQVIAAVLTIAVYFYLGRVAVALGSAQLAYFHVVIVFATFVPWFYNQRWELLSFRLIY